MRRRVDKRRRARAAEAAPLRDDEDIAVLVLEHHLRLVASIFAARPLRLCRRSSAKDPGQSETTARLGTHEEARGLSRGGGVVLGQQVHGVAVLTLATVVVCIVHDAAMMLSRLARRAARQIEKVSLSILLALAVRVREDTKVLPQLLREALRKKTHRQLLRLLRGRMTGCLCPSGWAAGARWCRALGGCRSWRWRGSTSADARRQCCSSPSPP